MEICDYCGEDLTIACPSCGKRVCYDCAKVDPRNDNPICKNCFDKIGRWVLTNTINGSKTSKVNMTEESIKILNRVLSERGEPLEWRLMPKPMEN